MPVVQPAVDQQLLSRIGFNEALHSAGIAPEYATALYWFEKASGPEPDWNFYASF